MERDVCQEQNRYVSTFIDRRKTAITGSVPRSCKCKIVLNTPLRQLVKRGLRDPNRSFRFRCKTGDPVFTLALGLVHGLIGHLEQTVQRGIAGNHPDADGAA